MTKREKEFQKADMYLLSFVVLTLVAAAILLPIMVDTETREMIERNCVEHGQLTREACHELVWNTRPYGVQTR
jgi:hypothetical protein